MDFCAPSFAERFFPLMVISNLIINETSSPIASKWKEIKHKSKKAEKCTEKHETPFENINEEFYKYNSLSTKISIR